MAWQNQIQSKPSNGNRENCLATSAIIITPQGGKRSGVEITLYLPLGIARLVPSYHAAAASPEAGVRRFARFRGSLP